MTTLREAAQLALTAMEESEEYGQYLPSGAIDTLREALADQSEQALEMVEPVAWMVYTIDGKSAFVTDNPKDFTQDHRALPLYTHPPQRKPLTDAELVDIVGNCAADSGGWFRYHAFARAIEQAHGIGEKE